MLVSVVQKLDTFMNEHLSIFQVLGPIWVITVGSVNFHLLFSRSFWIHICVSMLIQISSFTSRVLKTEGSFRGQGALQEHLRVILPATSSQDAEPQNNSAWDSSLPSLQKYDTSQGNQGMRGIASAFLKMFLYLLCLSSYLNLSI